MCGTLDRVCDRTAQNNGNIYSAFSFSHTLSDMLACALAMAKMVEPSSQISKHPDYMGSSPHPTHSRFFSSAICSTTPCFFAGFQLGDNANRTGILYINKAP
jgi:hypothetical protein